MDLALGVGNLSVTSCDVLLLSLTTTEPEIVDVPNSAC